MNILITGADGFIGKNLAAALRCIQDGRDRTHPEITVAELYLYDVASPASLLEEACQKADFVFHLAGVNRPQDPEEFIQGNVDFSRRLLNTLRKHQNSCPVMLASSVQASLVGRYDSEYGRSKKAGEELFFAYGQETGAKVLVYRFPNVFGKWCRPNYNSAVATFCHNIARDLPITVRDESTELELVYIDDLVAELLAALTGKEHREDRFCRVPVTHHVTLGAITGLLEAFRAQPHTLMMPQLPQGSFEKKLYSTYVSYLPKERIAVPLKMNRDARGSFTELLRTESCGQFSINITKPGVTKGQHWHHSKWEFFMVVSGTGLIRMRRIDSDEVLDFHVSSENLRAVHMLPGYTHSITNLSDSQELVTVMWANECFDPQKPDTFFQEV